MSDDDSGSGRRGRGKGKGGGGDGGKPREDSVQEIVISGVLERLASALGESAPNLLPESMRSAVLKYAGKKNIPGAMGALSLLAQTFAGDEEARGALRGFIDGLGKAIAETPEAELEKKARSYLDGSEHLKNLASFAAQGRFRDMPRMPYGDAFSYLSPPQQTQVLKLVRILPPDQIDLGAARFTPRELMAVASEVDDLGPERVMGLRMAQFKKPESPTKNVTKQGEQLLKDLRNIVQESFKPRPGERPLEERLVHSANVQIAAGNALDRAMKSDAPTSATWWTGFKRWLKS